MTWHGISGCRIDGLVPAENALKLATAQFAFSSARGKRNPEVTTLNILQHDKHKMSITHTFDYKGLLSVIVSQLSNPTATASKREL
jgi:hypothetical protein